MIVGPRYNDSDPAAERAMENEETNVSEQTEYAHQVQISLNMAGTGTIKVDGHDLASKVTGVDINSRAGDVTQVTLHMPQGVEFDGPALVTVVPDPDAAALRAEVDEWKRQWQGADDMFAAARDRADAAEARLALVTEYGIATAIVGRYSSFDHLTARGIAQAVLALVAADEQAAEPSPCICKTVNVGGCLAGCTDERVIDSACTVHGVSVPGGAA